MLWAAARLQHENMKQLLHLISAHRPPSAACPTPSAVCGFHGRRCTRGAKAVTAPAARSCPIAPLRPPRRGHVGGQGVSLLAERHHRQPVAHQDRGGSGGGWAPAQHAGHGSLQPPPSLRRQARRWGEQALGHLFQQSCVWRCTQPGMPQPQPPPRRHFTAAAAAALTAARLPPARLPRVAAERVKVFVRIRPTKEEGETPGGLRPKADGKGVVIYRE